eukprot:CAMPEP_0201912842 /NCGR_PEP_ID=MMETSP0903-20130614/3408_1 /ASSEMBLY_ACC=CAM_ASM_000552 /TAXON_ID=420261 /ORGANISM="Thalassiosira antarctica, Strain CCMP982" /LENGTH=67 /DNA_ID=CAMNT_0048447889 /DNA_START=430 /DNA_END=634 /DNA_ORIENTATION=-
MTWGLCQRSGPQYFFLTLDTAGGGFGGELEVGGGVFGRGVGDCGEWRVDEDGSAGWVLVGRGDGVSG